MIFQSFLVALFVQSASTFSPRVPYNRLSTTVSPTSSGVLLNAKKSKKKKDAVETFVESLANEAAVLEKEPLEENGISVEDTSSKLEDVPAETEELDDVPDEMQLFDEANMMKAIQMAQSA